MDEARFKRMVERLERESAAAPGMYRAKVAGLVAIGFGLVALMVGAAGFGLLLIAGIVVAIAVTGGAAWLALLKFGKLLLLLAIPLWLLIRNAGRMLFTPLPPPPGRPVSRQEAPALFTALDRMRRQMRGPRFHRVQVVDGVNAAVVQRPAFGLVGPSRNTLLLGLALLEALPPEEALAVVAHEYGHLAGSHGRFAAFVYRLRHTWGMLQAQSEQMQGWLGRAVAPLLRWYAPYFNAYTFVLARADEFSADAASAELVGSAHAADALKRVNLVAPQHQRFMQRTFERIDHDPKPPADLMARWATEALQAPSDADCSRWLGDALDREGHYSDTHPTLRARLAALPAPGDPAEGPPPVKGESAAAAWLGALADTLRREAQQEWAEGVARPWSERHDEAMRLRGRLAALRALPALDAAQRIEALQLQARLEAQADLREPLAAFNAEHPEHPLGLYLEGIARLAHGEREGLAMLEAAMRIDPEATKPACERAHAFLVEQRDRAAAEAYAERWRARDALESRRQAELQRLEPSDVIEAHGFDAETLAAIARPLAAAGLLRGVARVYLARRRLVADPTVTQTIVGIELTRWAGWCSRQREVVQRFAAASWPVPLIFVTLDGRYRKLAPKFRRLRGARLR